MYLRATVTATNESINIRGRQQSTNMSVLLEQNFTAYYCTECEKRVPNENCPSAPMFDFRK